MFIALWVMTAQRARFVRWCKKKIFKYERNENEGNPLNELFVLFSSDWVIFFSFLFGLFGLWRSHSTQKNGSFEMFTWTAAIALARQ